MKSDLIDAFYVLVKHTLSTTAAVKSHRILLFSGVTVGFLFAVRHQFCSSQLCPIQKCPEFKINKEHPPGNVWLAKMFPCLKMTQQGLSFELDKS